LSVPIGLETALSTDPRPDLASLARQRWDVGIIGAGPAGASAALLLAQSGLQTLLVDRADMPRVKVCGGCLNASGLDSLRALGLGDLPAQLGARTLTRVELRTSRFSASFNTRGVAISRATLDAALAKAATRAGAVFLSGTRATVALASPEHRLGLTRGDERAEARCRVVIAATGLGDSFAAGDPLPVHIAAGSRLGGGALLGPVPTIQPGTVYLNCGTGGYVGLVRVEGEVVAVAAALEPAMVKGRGGLGPAAEAITLSTGLTELQLARRHWRGTPPLTQARARIATERLFVIGDAAGYVEPFTGEGMAWALAGAREVAPLVRRALDGWDGSIARAWEQRYRETIGRRQALCRAVMALMRRPLGAQAAAAILSVAPLLAAPFIASINAPVRPPHSTT
jgi:flavin-dependent dehydrogenase